jgi:hypothetical protein
MSRACSTHGETGNVTKFYVGFEVLRAVVMEISCHLPSRWFLAWLILRP